MKITRTGTSKQVNPAFIVVISFISVISLQVLALALLYYQSIITDNQKFAQASSTPKQYLFQQAELRGLNHDLLYEIIDCESHWRMVSNSTSSAHGFFQILDRTEQYTPQYQAGLRKTDPYVNIDMGLYLYETYGTSPWLESRACWGWKAGLTQE